MIVVLDVCGGLALMLPYTPVEEFNTRCMQFENTHSGGPKQPPMLIPDPHVGILHMEDPCDNSAERMSADVCVDNSVAMLKGSQGAVYCRYTSWPDALFFCYVVTVLSGSVLLAFRLYRWFNPAAQKRFITTADGQVWAIPGADGELEEVETRRKVVPLSPAAAAVPSRRGQRKKGQRNSDGVVSPMAGHDVEAGRDRPGGSAASQGSE